MTSSESLALSPHQRCCRNHRSTGGVVGHFTQVVWRGSTHVGAAVSPNGQFVVANYSPPGNWMGQVPWSFTVGSQLMHMQESSNVYPAGTPMSSRKPKPANPQPGTGQWDMVPDNVPPEWNNDAHADWDAAFHVESMMLQRSVW